MSGAATNATNSATNGARICATLPNRPRNAKLDSTHRQRQRADADRIDVVQVRALELDVPRAEAQRLVDDEVRGERAEPAGREVRVDHQDALDRAEDADLHEQQREQHVEHQPDDAARMACVRREKKFDHAIEPA